MEDQNVEKRLLLAFALSLVVYLVYANFFMAPPPAPPAAPEGQPAPVEAGEVAPEAVAGGPEASGPGEAAPPGEAGIAWAALAGEGPEEVSFESDLFHVRLTNRGGRILSWKLTEYSTKDGRQLELIPGFDGAGELFPLAVRLDDAELTRQVNEALYRVERRPVQDGTEIEFRWADGTGIEVRKALTFRPGGYLVEADLEVTDRGRRRPAMLVWGPGFGAQDPAAENSNYYYSGQVVWNQRGAVTRKARTKADDGQVGALRWAGLEDQYFAALLVPREGDAVAQVAVEERVRLAPDGTGADGEKKPEPEAVAAVALEVPREGILLFVGPKKYRLLLDQGHELEKVVWFATNGFLAAVSKFLFLCLLWVYDHTIHNYGMAIVLTTVTLRVLLFPLNQYSMVSIKKTQVQMQRLQPKLAAIKKRYQKQKDAESRRKMNEETLALYRKEGVNPMGGVTGCLPLLAQFPILIGFYNMLTVAIELRGAPFFGWIQDLSEKDPYWITPLLMGGTMLLQQKMAVTKVTDPMQRQQQRIMMIMPVFFTFICIQMPSGLVLYWFVNNVLGIGQQWLVNKRAEQLVPQPEPEKAHGKRKRVRRSDAAGGTG